ncbi:alpha-amylase family glycosyl hydrolase [Synechococcus sp. PCC 6312]|uniref:alpha-amylase family glycosyl hydrolase n=1 Tax=Synechococcus sp. (strain ATCC 27167 / PCC 6312) TaxID=195253 RepID=UPI0002F66583|nr:alpha-amylase family glycosyl hydrolase [Synechococcus sp. PCC 6312]
MSRPYYPSLYQINTRVWLQALSQDLGCPATLDHVPDYLLDTWAKAGFNWLWCLSVWQTSPTSQEVSRAFPAWQSEFQAVLPDLETEDICGSGFAIQAYDVAPKLGGNVALQRFRQRLNDRGLKLMLDFVPNHTGLDHPWLQTHPEYFISGTESDLANQPKNYYRLPDASGGGIYAYGRDPYFADWPDTLQLNYTEPGLVAAMTEELVKISALCDGVRCDVAMLVLPDVFALTWGRAAQSFWPEAIAKVQAAQPGFCFLAEVYWDLEWRLHEAGFDYTYDKQLYDRLRSHQVAPVREHLSREVKFHNQAVRFLENHDEQRAAVTFSFEVHQAAAIITYLTPGLRFFYDGQLQGYPHRISPHLGRQPQTPVNASIEAFYQQLLTVLQQNILRTGTWEFLTCRPAWSENGSWANFLAWAWTDEKNWLLVVVNYAPYASQCYVDLPWPELAGESWWLQDQLSAAGYERQGDELRQRGLYLDIPAWGYHLFEFGQV